MLPGRAAPGWSVVSDDGPSARAVFVPPTSPARIITVRPRPSALPPGRPLDVAAELLAHRREDLLGEGVVLPRSEADVERGGEHVHRDALFDRRHDRPAPLARVGDHARVVRERRVLDEGLRGEVEEPGRDDGAAPPNLGDVGDVEVVAQVGVEVLRARVPEDVEPLGVRLHEPVLDAVVDHLDEVAGARGTAVEVAVLGGAADLLASRRPRDAPHAGRERPEDRVEALDDRPLATDHEAVAALEPPDAAARADVYVVNLLLAKRLHPSHVVLIEGVAAVDDRVAGLEALREIPDDLLGRGPRRHHDPRDPRSEE